MWRQAALDKASLSLIGIMQNVGFTSWMTNYTICCTFTIWHSNYQYSFGFTAQVKHYILNATLQPFSFMVQAEHEPICLTWHLSMWRTNGEMTWSASVVNQSLVSDPTILPSDLTSLTGCGQFATDFKEQSAKYIVEHGQPQTMNHTVELCPLTMSTITFCWWQRS